MKQILRLTAAALLLVTMFLTVSAEETEPRAEPEMCTVLADSVTGKQRESITVPVRIENNVGFTNFGIALDYDRDQLELVSIQLTDDQGNPYLCGSWADSNIAWESVNGSYGYVVCALAEEAAEDGVLFTATFRVADGADAEAAVTPVVKYLRRYEEQDLSFGAVDCTVAAGSVTVEAGEPLLMGDVNDDGEVDTLDALLVYRAYIGLAELTEDQQLVADINEDGEWDTLDALLIYRVYKGA